MKKNKNWFTIIELLVVIAIIWILIVWSSRINFNPQIDKQNSEMFANNIFTSIENIRNNALLWRWIGSGNTFTHPEKWIVRFSTLLNGTQSGSIQATYLSWVVDYPYNDLKVDFINQNSQIAQLTCTNIDGSNSQTWNIIDIEFSWNTTTLSWCNNTHKILEIQTKYKNFEKTIKINSTTGLMEKF